MTLSLVPTSAPPPAQTRVDLRVDDLVIYRSRSGHNAPVVYRIDHVQPSDVGDTRYYLDRADDRHRYGSKRRLNAHVLETSLVLVHPRDPGNLV